MNRERTPKPAFSSGSGEGGFLLKERGIILFVALMVMALLALLGATFLTMSTTESTIAANETNMARAFNIAEAGLERAKARMKTGTEASLDAFLTGTSPGPNLYTNQAFDVGTYTVVIEDDVDGGSPADTDDTNDRVFIRSTGSLPNNPARKQILALVRSVKVPPMPTPRGAAETLANPGASSEIHGEPGAFDGRDWTPPADIGACSNIDGCGTKMSDSGTYGAFSNLAGISYALGSGGTMYGTGCISGACGTSVGTASHETDTSVPTTRWDSYLDAMIPRANQTLAGTVLDAAGTYTWGTPANPQITVINNTGNVDWKADVTGAGVLIIDSPGPTQNIIFSNGELNWQGLVIIRSPGEVQFEINNAAGRLRVFGVFVNRSATQAEIELKKDNNFIKYSSTAVNMVNQNLGGTFTVLNWREVAL